MLSVKAGPELKAAVLLMQRAQKETKTAVRKEAQSFAPVLKRAIEARARDPLDRRIAATTKTTTTNAGLKAVVGSTGRTPSGTPLREVTRPQEYGTSRPEARKKYLSRYRGTRTYVNRRTQRQVPSRFEKGRFVNPAIADTTPELVARWVRAVARAVSGG